MIVTSVSYLVFSIFSNDTDNMCNFLLQFKILLSHAKICSTVSWCSSPTFLLMRSIKLVFSMKLLNKTEGDKLTNTPGCMEVRISYMYFNVVHIVILKMSLMQCEIWDVCVHKTVQLHMIWLGGCCCYFDLCT